VGPKAFLAYLCRYTHRVAISNSRIENLDRERGTVTFRYKDYRHGGRPEQMTLALPEFLRRFCLHILPPHTVKIRNYGLLSNRNRVKRIEQARALLAQATPSTQQPRSQTNPINEAPAPRRVCPFCGSSKLVLLEIVDRPKSVTICDSS
jgi:hypothetical protein